MGAVEGAGGDVVLSAEDAVVVVGVVCSQFAVVERASSPAVVVGVRSRVGFVGGSGSSVRLSLLLITLGLGTVRGSVHNIRDGQRWLWYLWIKIV